MNPNKQSACHVMSKYAITRAGGLAGAKCMWRVAAAHRSTAPPERSRGAGSRSGLSERLAGAPTEPACGCRRPDQVPKRSGIKKSWVGFPDFASVAGKIRIGRDGDFFPDF